MNSIIYNRSEPLILCRTQVNKMLDKSTYGDWAKAWDAGMICIGEWKQGECLLFCDKSGTGTKVLIEELSPYQSIKFKHIAMVDAEGREMELSDEFMRKWIGSRESWIGQSYIPLAYILLAG